MPPHETHMRRALDLARRGEGRVEPNPVVGAVLVEGDRVVAEGWHDAFGGPHAELVALRIAALPPSRSPTLPRSHSPTLSLSHSPTLPLQFNRATLYTTLEPCAHFGKTPPCAPAIIKAGIRRVVVAARDPNPAVAGRGIRMLRRAGIEVVVGVCGREAEAQNAPFFKLHRTGLPWVIAKWAMSADGKIATREGDSRWITGREARAFARRLRARCQAVIVGIGTALADDPRLLPDLPPGPPPPVARPYLRVVLDSRARLPLRSRLVRSARETPVLIAVSALAPARRRRALEEAGCEICVIGRRRPDLGRLLGAFGRRGFTHVLVEGGGEVLGSAFDDRLVDEVYAFIAPRVIGGTSAPSPVGGNGPAGIADSLSLEHAERVPIGSDILLHGFPGRGAS
jgi:diaminohydroxyphosphoribosylaminopyrimidine deaminase/5-amino-6-(5-phosphoribosylamino)uracil reductase